MAAAASLADCGLRLPLHEVGGGSLVVVVGLNFGISWSCKCWSYFAVNSVQVSLRPRGVRAKEGCSTEQLTLVLALEFSVTYPVVLATRCAGSFH